MTNALAILALLVLIESAIYHGIGIYRHIRWFRKKKPWVTRLEGENIRIPPPEELGE